MQPSSRNQQRTDFRRPEIDNPYGSYLGTCGWIVALSVVVGCSAIGLPQPWQILLTILSLAVGSITAVTGLMLWPFVRAAARQVARACDDCLACWIYPAETWNAFAATQREAMRSEMLIPIVVLPTVGLVVGIVLALLEHWIWLIVLPTVGLAMSATVAVMNRKIREDHYQFVRGTAEVWITRGLLALPGYTLIWNNLAPRLYDVAIESNEDEEMLVFHYICQAENRQHDRSIMLPIPDGDRCEAERIVDAFCGES